MLTQDKTVLTTKLFPPLVKRDILSRPRLIDLLTLSLDHKLTLISAPAGYGKTTLISQFARSGHRPCAWLSLDKDDNDPVRFWTHFISALQAVQPEIRTLTLQIPPNSGGTPAKTMLTTLVKEITNRTTDLTNPCIFFLDQYNVIDNQSIHDSLIFLIENLSTQLRLVIATRIEPPFPIFRLRANGHVGEIRTEDLRFTKQEIGELLRDILSIALSENDISVLEARTEGWIASLQLLAISMKRRNDISDFMKSFSGSHRHILDYLTEEVLNQQTADVRSFLLETSILDQLNSSLCNAVTKRPDSQEILKKLESTNLFIVPLDDERNWYRYHHLLAELLQHHLNQKEPDMIRTLHRRASEWFEKNGMPIEAVNHSFSWADLDHTAGLIEKIAENLLMRGEIITLQTWIQSLPETVICSQAFLCVFHALSLLYTGGSMLLIESRLNQAEASTDGNTVSGALTAIRAYIAMLQGNANLSIELSNTALKYLPSENSLLQLHITGFLGRMLMMNGNVLAAIQNFERVAEISQRTANIFLYVRALNRLAELHVMQGQLHEAERHYDQILKVATDNEGQPLPIAGIAYMGLGELLREWNDLEAATKNIEEGIALTKKYSEIRAINGYISLARIKQAQGYDDIASEIIQKAMLLAEQYDIDNIKKAYVGQRQVRLWILQGKTELAIELIKNSKFSEYSDSLTFGSEDIKIPEYYLVDEIGKITLARLFISSGKADDALQELQSIQENAERQGRRGNQIEILMLQALAYNLKGNRPDAIGSLKLSLSLAKRAGYIRTFLDEGKPMQNLLRLANSRCIDSDYISTLLDIFHQNSFINHSESNELLPNLVTNEHLSDREMQVLRLIEKGFSNKNIAEKLYLNVGTIKKHRYNIYKKLNVSSLINSGSAA